MIRDATYKIFVSTVFVAAFLLFLSCEKTSDSNRREVVLYCSVDQAIAEPVIAAFEAQSGIKVLARYDTEASKTVGLVQRLRAESGSPIADVFWSSEIFHSLRLANESLLESYNPELVPDRPANYSYANNQLFGFALRARVIAYHTDRLSATEAPRSLEEVLERKWKGRIVMASPEFGTTGGDVASWFVHYGAERAREILRELKKNEIRLVDGNSTAVRMVATGQADVCFTDTDDVYAAQRNDWPIAMHFLDQGHDGVLVIPNTAALIKEGPHPAEARELLQFLLSENLERMMVQSDSHNTPIHASLAEEYPSYAIAHRLSVDYHEVAAHLPQAIQSAREILR